MAITSRDGRRLAKSILSRGLNLKSACEVISSGCSFITNSVAAGVGGNGRLPGRVWQLLNKKKRSSRVITVVCLLLRETFTQEFSHLEISVVVRFSVD